MADGSLETGDEFSAGAKGGVVMVTLGHRNLVRNSVGFCAHIKQRQVPECHRTISPSLISWFLMAVEIGGHQPLWLLICGSALRYAGSGGEFSIRPVRREQ